MIPGSGGTQRLARMVGLGRAKDIVMRGRRISSDEALALGLVTRVVNADELDGAVSELIDELSRHSPLALRMARRVLNAAYDGPLHLGLELEGSPTGSCARRTTSARASRRSAKSGRRSSQASKGEAPPQLAPGGRPQG